MRDQEKQGGKEGEKAGQAAEDTQAEKVKGQDQDRGTVKEEGKREGQDQIVAPQGGGQQGQSNERVAGAAENKAKEGTLRNTYLYTYTHFFKGCQNSLLMNK